MTPHSTHAFDFDPGPPVRLTPLRAPSLRRTGPPPDTLGGTAQAGPAQLARLGMRALSFAHEVANPLNGMSVQAQLLQRATWNGGDPEVAFRVGELVGEIDRLKRLIADFRGSLSADPARVAGQIDLRVALDRALRFVAIDPRIEVRTTVPSSLPALGTGADEVQQVLLNLIKNAVEAMPTGGTLSVRVHSDSHSVHVEISDTGAGFGIEHNPLAPQRIAKRSGGGLGLRIVQRLVSALGGALTFSSTAGVGTIFALALPIASGAAASRQGSPACAG